MKNKSSIYYVKEFDSVIIDKQIIKDIIPEITSLELDVLFQTLKEGIFDDNIKELLSTINELNKSILKLDNKGSE